MLKLPNPLLTPHPQSLVLKGDGLASEDLSEFVLIRQDMLTFRKILETMSLNRFSRIAADKESYNKLTKIVIIS